MQDIFIIISSTTMSSAIDPDDVASFSITLKILEGRELVAKDRNLLGRRTTSDPWVEVFLGDKNYGHRTEVVEKTCDPKWNATIKILLMDDHARSVLKHEHPFRLVIWDQDLAIDDCMGVVDIDLINTKMDEPEWTPVEKGDPDVRAEGQRIHYCKNAAGELLLQYTIKVKTKQEAFG